MKVNDVNIEDDHIVVNAKDNLIKVAQEMAKVGIPDAIVTKEDGSVLGALDDYDIVSKCIAEEKDPKEMTAEDVMYAGPKVKLDTDLSEVNKTLQSLRATVLPVVDDDNKLLGVITINDVWEGLADEEETKGFFAKMFS
jgi:CBS domain-containing protein